MTKYTTEYRARVYDDDHGFFVEVRDDGDSIGLCELAYSDGDKDAEERLFAISWEHAERFAQAILLTVKARSDANPANEGAEK